MVNKINFISNNINGFQSANKKSKLNKYFKNKIVSSGFLFLQEMHSTVNDEIEWKDDSGKLFTRTVNLIHAMF